MTPTRAATTAPTRAATTAPTTAARQTPQPNGTVPAGWKVYRGTPQVPFAMAYPPDWTVDESNASNGYVDFAAPDGILSVRISTEGKVRAGANVDVLRDQYFQAVAQACTKAGQEYTGTEMISGIQFAELGATCDASGTLLFFIIGAGLKNGVEWDFLMSSLYKDFNKNTCACAAGNLEKYFSPMLSSLNIYANP